MRITNSYEHNVDTSVGSQSIKQIHPTNLKQLAISNSIMRLMAEDGNEQPLDKYVRFKTAPQLWYNEMRDYGLTEEEIKVLEKYLKDKDGVADSQEVVMQLSMDPHISNFTMEEANKLRKTIAKKVFKDIEKVHQLYLTKGTEAGTSMKMLTYVWDKQFKLSFGYSFSSIHTTGYSLIAVQEMNLAYYYPIIYWNTACLSVDSSAINASDFYSLIDDEIINLDQVEGKKANNKMDYAKLAAALDSFRGSCKIQLPDINISRLGFTPDVENNTIIYGLKGISRITDPVINVIMENRPFSSFNDFLNKVDSRLVTKDKIVNLIKCGAFDRIEKKDRSEILKDYILSICGAKQRLTLQNANMLIDFGLFPKELEEASETYKITKELRKHRDLNKLWYQGDNINIPTDKVSMWRAIVQKSHIPGQSMTLDGIQGKWIDSAKWDRFYDLEMDKLRSYIKTHSSDLLKQMNNKLFMDEWNKYCSGDQLQWELDSLNFYFSGHPLYNFVNRTNLPFEISKLSSIQEGAMDGFFIIKGKQIPRMLLYTIAGTVIDRDKVKGMVTLQTPDGVLNMKVYKDLYSTMVAVIGEENVEQDSFFEKGIHLLVTGVQRGSTFIPKVYKSTGHKAIMKINLEVGTNRFVSLEEKQSVGA